MHARSSVFLGAIALLGVAGCQKPVAQPPPQGCACCTGPQGPPPMQYEVEKPANPTGHFNWGDRAPQR